MFQETQNNRENVALIDADSILYMAGWDTFNKSYYTDIYSIYQSADRIVSSILLDTKSTHYLGFLGKGITFRREIVNTYKSNRDNLVKPDHFENLKNHLVNHWGFYFVYKYEVDDAVGIIKNKHPEYIICSPDKDVKQGIPGTHYDYKKKEWITTSKEEAELFFWKQMIEGDTADGIKGLPGKGKKFSEAFFNNFYNPYSASPYLLEFPSEVLMLYIQQFGEYKGIEEFYKSYIQLKILTNDDSFLMPIEPTKLNSNLLIL